MKVNLCVLIHMVTMIMIVTTLWLLGVCICYFVTANSEMSVLYTFSLHGEILLFYSYMYMPRPSMILSHGIDDKFLFQVKEFPTDVMTLCDLVCFQTP